MPHSPLPDSKILSGAQSSEHFFSNLPALDQFSEAVSPECHTDIPRDWWVIVADIAGSTQAIEEGGYKKVNTVGVACIAAIVNVDRQIEIPYVFGGDGATFAVPQSLFERAVIALRGAQQLSTEQFGLELRVGCVRADHLLRDGYEVRLGKIKLSAHVSQTCLSGSGWEEAERRVKDPSATDVTRVRLSPEAPAEANFDGFECRWKSVQNFNGHKLALLVAATSGNREVDMVSYQNLIEVIREIYGETEDYHPLRPDELQLSLNPLALTHEWRVRTGQSSKMSRLRYFVSLLVQGLAGRYLFARKRDTQFVRWSRYRDELVEHTDFRKFDGLFRMVIDGSEDQYVRLRDYLEIRHAEGLLAFGMHKSSEALITCLVQSYNGNHMHFVDGSDGGYAIAARALKKQLKSLRQPAILA